MYLSPHLVHCDCMTGAVKLLVVTDTPIQSSIHWTFPQFSLFFIAPLTCVSTLSSLRKISRAPLLVSNLRANLAIFVQESRGQHK